jgi:hypothetical protein
MCDPVVFASDLLPESWAFTQETAANLDQCARTRQRTCTAIPDHAKFFTERASLLVLMASAHFANRRDRYVRWVGIIGLSCVAGEDPGREQIGRTMGSATDMTTDHIDWNFHRGSHWPSWPRRRIAGRSCRGCRILGRFSKFSLNGDSHTRHTSEK